MSELFLLVKAEYMKLFKTKAPYVLFILTVLIMGGVVFNEYNYIKDMEYLQETDPDFADRYGWHSMEERTLEYGPDMLEDPYYSNIQKDQIERRLDIAKFRLENEIGRDIFKNGWWFFSNSMFDWIIRLILLIVVLVGIQNVAGEFQSKTINLWLTTPYQRWKILTAKFISILGLGIAALASVYVFGSLSGLVLYGFEGLSVDVVLSGTSGPYLMPYALYALIILGFKFIELIFVLSLTFMIAILLKSTGATTITALLTTFLVPSFVVIISKHYSIFEWLPFNHVDFRKFIDYGRSFPEIENTFTNIVNPNFGPLMAASIVVVYIIIFLSITYYSFCKRDVH